MCFQYEKLSYCLLLIHPLIRDSIGIKKKGWPPQCMRVLKSTGDLVCTLVLPKFAQSLADGCSSEGLRLLCQCCLLTGLCTALGSIPLLHTSRTTPVPIVESCFELHQLQLWNCWNCSELDLPHPLKWPCLIVCTHVFISQKFVYRLYHLKTPLVSI